MTTGTGTTMRTFQLSLLLALLVSLVGPLHASPQTSAPAGETRTLLADGRWLVVGGEDPRGPLATAAIVDARTGATTELPRGMAGARAWHTATTLPDGTVAILGGRGVAGTIPAPELFRPDTGQFEPLVAPIAERARHTATLLTGGRVVIAGGVDAAGHGRADAEIWDPRSGAVTPVPGGLGAPRSEHDATLMPDGTVLLSGGTAGGGGAIAAGDVYDPRTGRFMTVSHPSPHPLAGDPPQLTGSQPVNGDRDVAVHATIVLRFSTPLDVGGISSGVFLTSTNGPEHVQVVPAEGGRLLFVIPERGMRADSSYTLLLNGVTSEAGIALRPTSLSFTTARRPTGQREADGRSQGASSNSPSTGETTAPSRATGTVLESAGENTSLVGEPGRSAEASSSRTGYPPLRGPHGVTALSGQVLQLNGQPLSDVTLAIQATTARTDTTGRFLLTGAAAGVHTLLIDGGSASRTGAVYGTFEVNVELRDGETTVLPYTIWMPKLDVAHAVEIPAYTTSEIVVATPRIPGLELRIPAHASIRDRDGQPVTQVTITLVPLDRPPFPLPTGVEVPLYFTIQPGGAYIATRYGNGARLIYPNSVRAEPGTHFEFWDYEASRKGWYIYGLGTVSGDGRHVVPDPGVSIYEFSGAMVAPPSFAPALAPPPDGDTGGDPVDLATGVFVFTNTDLTLPDVVPAALTRTYRSQDTRSRAFGVGTSHPYDMFLVGNTNPYTWADLVLENGSRIHFDRISAGTGWTDAVYEHLGTPTRFYKARMTWNGNGWDVKLKDGTVYVFPFGDAAQRPQQAALKHVQDRYGNRLSFTRDAAGNLTRIATPSGRWIDLTYDASYRITQARDIIGRTVNYTYDTSGRLASVTDRAGGVTRYAYDASHRMSTLTDARGTVSLTNQYDAAGRVARQMQADGGTYTFGYVVDPGTGKISRTDVTDPRGVVRTLTFNSGGYPIAETRAYGSTVAQPTTLTRDSTSHRILSRTDALGRVTAYGYDASGNVTSVTWLAGTAAAVTRSLTYEPTFNQVTRVTDALNQTVTYAYSAAGALTTITNPAGAQQTRTYNSAGQLLSATTPNERYTFTYASGDQVARTDGSGATTRRIVDGAGRVIARLDPTGRRTRYEYDAMDRLVRYIDALGGVTTFAYDANGNTTTITNARGHTSRLVYDASNRPVRRVDASAREETFTYDALGNLVQMVDRKGQRSTFVYDALNRRTTATFADGSTISYTYDAGGRLVQVRDSVAGTITRLFDGFDRLTEETTPQATVRYTYDAAGRRTTMTVAGQAAVSYGYGAGSALSSVTQASTSVQLAHDAGGRRTAVVYPNGVVSSYAYDAGSRVSRIAHARGSALLGDVTYDYDAGGGPVQIGGTWGTVRTPAGLTAATYDAANRQVSFDGVTQAHDANGNMISDGVHAFTWDARNRLVSIQGPDVTASFAYDALGRRTRRVVDGVSTDFVYDRATIVREISPQAGAANILTTLNVDDPLVRIEASGAMALLGDGRGSIAAVTNGSGAVLTRYVYEPFGAGPGDAATANTLQYSARENDGTGLLYYRARYYSPRLHRFLSEDPAGLRSGDYNLYAYVANSPLRWRDPVGTDRSIWRPFDPGRRILDGPRNGNWGGGNWSGGYPGDVPIGSVGLPLPPTDSADDCYMHHDYCYDDCDYGCRDRNCYSDCNRDIVKCLDQLPYDPTQWPMPPVPGTEDQSRKFADDARWYFHNRTKR
jgi:RHS repeat-associated protein